MYRIDKNNVSLSNKDYIKRLIKYKWNEIVIHDIAQHTFGISLYDKFKDDTINYCIRMSGEIIDDFSKERISRLFAECIIDQNNYIENNDYIIVDFVQSISFV